ncbi:SHOCT domain-containing protein [Mycobacterium sp. smrl_JER01]|uniref:SHOCT domain-containing protein n=1 Tax=Mycobacterium sp. smrl_JER01 TaxID=3402633 RepID=UPI003AC29A4D
MNVPPDADRAVTDIARRHGLSRDAVLAMLAALYAGGGTMAQFSIPELGGSGQWMRGGMTMVGDMFDNALKARVDAVCNELVHVLSTTAVFPAGHWWPAELGVPSATGGQNDVRYAVFPSTRRLAVDIRGTVRVFDTGEHRIGGVQQQQGGRHGSVSFTSQLGTFDISALPEVGARPTAAPAEPTAAPAEPTAAPAEPTAAPDPAAIVAAIESLAGLHQRGILTDEEFAVKKAELLARL